jgi:hypothetical protein
MKFVVFVDQDKTSRAAFKMALERFDPEKDQLVLINVYSSWDMLNDEKNSGMLALEEFKSYVKAIGVCS